MPPIVLGWDASGRVIASSGRTIYHAPDGSVGVIDMEQQELSGQPLSWSAAGVVGVGTWPEQLPSRSRRQFRVELNPEGSGYRIEALVHIGEPGGADVFGVPMPEIPGSNFRRERATAATQRALELDDHGRTVEPVQGTRPSPPLLFSRPLEPPQRSSDEKGNKPDER